MDHATNGNYISISDVESYVSIDFTSDNTIVTDHEVGDYIAQIEAEIDSILASCNLKVPLVVVADENRSEEEADVIQARYRNLLKVYGVKAVVAAVIASGDIRPGLTSTDVISQRESAYLTEYYQNLDKLAQSCQILFVDADTTDDLQSSGLPSQAIEIDTSLTWTEVNNNIEIGVSNIQIVGRREFPI